jgi:MoxR-like ATPase
MKWLTKRQFPTREGYRLSESDGRAKGMEIPETVEDLADILLDQNYLADRGLATATYLALCLGRPLLLEGEAGVGKTELAKAIASGFGLQLIRLQCYEGIDANQALYEWDYTRQLLYVRTLTEQALNDKTAIDDIFGPRFLVERPLLKAIKAGDRAVLLVDEIDRADDEFEAFLLEVLSDFQVTIPELGTVKCKRPPVVVLTSNRTRELHDALKRRCLFHWIDYPKLEREVEIVRARAPEVPEELARQVSKAVQNLRKMDLQKRPGVAETLDWARALDYLGAERMDANVTTATLGSVLKDRDDIDQVKNNLSGVIG